MNRNYHTRVLNVTHATKDTLMHLSERSITNNDRLTIYVCTDLLGDILRELAAALKAGHGKEVVEKHIRVKAPFAYRKLRPMVAAAFSLDGDPENSDLSE